jgi:protein-tyrosine-phosphatase
VWASRDGLDFVAKRKSDGLAGNWTPAVQPVAFRYTDWDIPDPMQKKDERTKKNREKVEWNKKKVLNK